MNKIICLFTFFVLSVITSGFAEEQEITLKDGSKIVGELVSINNGVYTIKAPIIGNVQAAASDVVSITNRQSGAQPTGPGNPTGSYQSPGTIPDLNQRVADQQKQLMSNPESMALLMQMAQDPEIAQMLQDPALVDAVTHHDLQAVQQNPKILELMNNPHMKAFLQKLEALQQHDHDHAPTP